MSLSNSKVTSHHRCLYCFSLPLSPWQDDFFEVHGLKRAHEGYARLGERVPAHCVDCGAERRISISDLTAGIAPCLRCAEDTDPDAIHVVYLMFFRELSAYKIGATSTEARNDRIASHAARGGTLLDQHEVPNREAALTVEAHVLGMVRHHPSVCTERDFPQGGYTETWSDDGPKINLAEVIARLTQGEAPGFDRLRKLRTYFSEAPATIEELVEFRLIETIKVDGLEVHHVGLSESEEQVLRKIRSRRTAQGQEDNRSRVEDSWAG
ncbi:hypothetical protein [Streptomyces iconiensis]|uniref:GIY-YIG nuclease family protein n=1 Tax=Streptomyces iconiensis TaxID=1384038 RepID=A0ABT7A125_9ACTN|nr:hypothetical protein [Streptomyces iconiensis]MDJ1135038.1 hypothetical protein [Streptomyces iconiensis]